jgi:tRNA nucleotidyltransferase/poly(A) polymerase
MSGVGENSAQLNLTVSKRTVEYLELMASRGSNYGPNRAAIAAHLLTHELTKMMRKEPNPGYWLTGLGEP